MDTLKNASRTQFLRVIKRFNDLKEINSIRIFFSATVIPWFCYHCPSKHLLILLIAKQPILLSKICTRNKLEYLTTSMRLC